MLHQNLQIARILLTGKTVTRQWAAKQFILVPHSRVRNISKWICEVLHKLPCSYDYQCRNCKRIFIGDYILNRNPKNKCAEYELLPRYRKALKAALKKRTKP